MAGAAGEPEPAVRLAGFRKKLGDKVIVDGIDLVVPEGGVLGYIGPNGAGKSTTVKVLIGLWPGFEGEAEVCGVNVAEDPQEVKSLVGYVPEAAAVYSGLTAFEHLQLVGRLHGLSDAVIQRRAEGMLEALDLADGLYTRLGRFSKGMKQKVLLASALIHDPRVLFLDEPLSGLDVGSTMVVKEVIRQLAERGTAVFYCSHMMDIVERVCDRIVILNEGRIIADGTFAELSERRGDRSLEDVFRELTGEHGGAERAQRIIGMMEDGS